MDNEERTAFTSLLAQLDSRNKRIKDLERQLDNYFIISQKYLKLKKILTEIKEIAENVIKNVSDRCIETTPMYGVHKQILLKISEVEE